MRNKKNIKYIMIFQYIFYDKFYRVLSKELKSFNTGKGKY